MLSDFRESLASLVADFFRLWGALHRYRRWAHALTPTPSTSVRCPLSTDERRLFARVGRPLRFMRSGLGTVPVLPTMYVQYSYTVRFAGTGNK